MKIISRTHQNSVFPIDPYHARQKLNNEEFLKTLREQFYHIKDDLLYDLITYGDDATRTKNLIKGFTYQKGIASGILTFLTNRAIDLYRLPFVPDRVYCSIRTREDGEALKALLATLSPSRVQSLTSEVRDLYDHTQRMLAKAGLTEVVLTRRIRDEYAARPYDVENYATKIVREKRIAEFHGQSSIKFEMDTLNSFGDGGYGHYPVMLEVCVPAADVLYCSNLIANRKIDYTERWVNHNHAVERGEWVVINRAPDGVIELPVEQIHLNDDCYDDSRSLSTTWLASQKVGDPIVLRALDHLRREDHYHMRGLRPKLLQRLSGAWEGMINGTCRGFRQGWFL
jgi:hypothetical protein